MDEQRKIWNPEKLKGKGRFRGEYWLSGTIKCLSCGHQFQGRGTRSHGNIHYYYLCGAYVMKGREICIKYSLPRDIVENFVLNFIKEERLNNQEWRNSLKARLQKRLSCASAMSESEAKAIDEELERVQHKIKNLIEYIAEHGSDKDAVDTRKEYESQKQKLLDRKKELDKMVEVKQELEEEAEEVLSYLDNFDELVKEGSWQEKKRWIKTFVDRIEVDPHNKKIAYYFYRIPNSTQGETGLLRYNPNSPHHYYSSLASNQRAILELFC